MDDCHTRLSGLDNQHVFGMKSVKAGVILLFCGILVIFSSCYEPREGCLDVKANNFDPSADISCRQACCTYPSLQWQCRHLVGPSNFSSDTAISDINGVPYRLVDCKILVSQVQLLDAVGNFYSIADSVTLTLSGNTLKLPDDMQIVGNSAFNYTFGSFQINQTFTGMRFTVGLPLNIAGSKPTDWPVGHPLALNTLFDLDTEHYYQGSLSFMPDTLLPDSIRTIYWGDAAEPVTIVYNFVGPFTPALGFDSQVGITLKHENWLLGADVQGDSDAVLKDLIFSNLDSIF
jgi:hypothetical protein